MARHGAAPFRYNGLHVARTAAVGLARVLFMSISAAAAPLRLLEDHEHDGHEHDDGGNLLGLYLASAVLVLLGGAFAGLTIALMGQDGIYLQVRAKDHHDPQHRNAIRVYNLLQRGKHWVLVTLLLANVVVNETLPVVLDRALGGGIAAVAGSTVLIVIFGEVVPQSVCVRYGLPIGGFMSKPVLVCMWLFAPVAWPIAKLLDYVLGESEDTVYKKSGLKTLITMHRSLGQILNHDEVTIISAVLDLKEKSVEDIMTPMEDVFVLSQDTVLDEPMIDMILSAGYSRIPVHETGNPTNWVGMLLVKILITYDPEDGKRVRDFELATLPETRPETSCLDILNFYQEGKAHMVLVSSSPGMPDGCLGVVTLEDVIEELIGEEIVDESDVYEDVHGKKRRKFPAPKALIARRLSLHSDGGQGDPDGGQADGKLSSSPKLASVLARQASGGPRPSDRAGRGSIDDLIQQARHLGPSNKAANPKSTKVASVKIKPGIVPAGDGSSAQPRAGSVQAVIRQIPEDDDELETTALLRPSVTGKDGVHALRQSYGAVGASSNAPSPSGGAVPAVTLELDAPPETEDHATQTKVTLAHADLSAADERAHRNVGDAHDIGAGHMHRYRTEPVPARSTDTLLSDNGSGGGSHRKSGVRSGSITENIIETRGIRKIVLETTSSTDDDDGEGAAAARPAAPRFSGNVSDVEEQDEDGDGDGDDAAGSAEGPSSPPLAQGQQAGGKKKNRRKKRKGGRAS